MPNRPLRLDEIGYWSELKLDIIREYASADSTILAKQAFIAGHVYIDGFAGPGTHVSRQTREYVAGSPANAMEVRPPFTELHFIDLDGARTAALIRMASNDSRVHVHTGDRNEILLRDVFPSCRYSDYRRALCVLDPYKLNVNCEVLKTAGEMKSIEIFYNFMIMDANMNVFMRDPDKADPEQRRRMDAVWGDDSWSSAAYENTTDLFGERRDKATNDTIAEAFRTRLSDVAGFRYVPSPIPMRNSRGAVVYYLYFASQNGVGGSIVAQIFDKYRNRGGD